MEQQTGGTKRMHKNNKTSISLLVMLLLSNTLDMESKGKQLTPPISHSGAETKINKPQSLHCYSHWNWQIGSYAALLACCTVLFKLCCGKPVDENYIYDNNPDVPCDKKPGENFFDTCEFCTIKGADYAVILRKTTLVVVKKNDKNFPNIEPGLWLGTQFPTYLLIIPKQHFSNIKNADQTYLQAFWEELFDTIKYLAERLNGTQSFTLNCYNTKSSNSLNKNKDSHLIWHFRSRDNFNQKNPRTLSINRAIAEAECPFCKSVGANKGLMVDQSDDYYLLRDTRPCAQTHLLVIPHNHEITNIKNLLLDDVNGKRLWKNVLKEFLKLANSLTEGKESFWLQNHVEKNGNQTVFHLHWHFTTNEPINTKYRKEDAN